MRIAIFTETFLPRWDGVTQTLCYLLEHLAKRGHASLMFAPENAPHSYADTCIVGLPSMAFPLYRDIKLVPPVFNVSDELAAFKPDLVHLVNPAVSGLAGIRHARNLNLPVIASYQTDFAAYAQHYGLHLFEQQIWAYFRWLHNKADLNLCPSNYTKRRLEAHDFERLAVWGHGVDTERFHPRHRSSTWRMRLTGGQPERTLLLYAGRLAREKRIEWLRPLCDTLPDASLAIVGDGPVREELEERFKGTPTVFTGYLQGEDLSQAYASADLFVFPSATETFGIVILEAMASGLPVVAVGAGGPVDQVHHDRDGYLSDPQDPADFLAWVERATADRDRLHLMGEAARAYAKTQTWEAVLDDLMDLYAELVTHAAAKAPAAV